MRCKWGRKYSGRARQANWPWKGVQFDVCRVILHSWCVIYGRHHGLSREGPTGTRWNFVSWQRRVVFFSTKKNWREGRGLSLEPISWSVCHARNLWNESAATLEHWVWNWMIILEEWRFFWNTANFYCSLMDMVAMMMSVLWNFFIFSMTFI